LLRGQIWAKPLIRPTFEVHRQRICEKERRFPQFFYYLGIAKARIMPDLLDKCRLFSQKHELTKPGNKVLVACSGGPDSMVLAWLMKNIVEEVGIAHCNFRLRPESDADAELVKSWAAENGITCHVVRFDTLKEKEKGESTQMAARRLRYEFFATLCAEQGYERIATAHHADDQVETLVMSFLRGRSGPLMLGIPVRYALTIRPLLFATKEEILGFAKEKKITFAIDASNATDNYDRNLVRNQILPAMEKLNPSVRSRFLEQYEEARMQYDLQVITFTKLLPKVISTRGTDTVLDFVAFRNESSESILPLFLTWYLRRFDLNMKMSAAIEARRILEADVGAIWETADHQLLRDRDCLIIRLQEKPEPWQQEIVKPEGSEEAVVAVGEKEVATHIVAAKDVTYIGQPSNVHFLALESVTFPLLVRPWREGDRLQPLGMAGHKKLSDIFIDQRFDRFSKENALVFEDKDGIVLLDDFRIDERVKIKPETTHILRIEIRSLSDRSLSDRSLSDRSLSDRSLSDRSLSDQSAGETE
jgi:tRNA(Ile)-lysidine synthase